MDEQDSFSAIPESSVPALERTSSDFSHATIKSQGFGSLASRTGKNHIRRRSANRVSWGATVEQPREGASLSEDHPVSAHRHDEDQVAKQEELSSQPGSAKSSRSQHHQRSQSRLSTLSSLSFATATTENHLQTPVHSRAGSQLAIVPNSPPVSAVQEFLQKYQGRAFPDAALATGAGQSANFDHDLAAKAHNTPYLESAQDTTKCSMCADKMSMDCSCYICDCTFQMCSTCTEHVSKYENKVCPSCKLPMLNAEAQAELHEERREEKRQDAMIVRPEEPKAERTAGYGSVLWKAPTEKPSAKELEADIKAVPLFRTLAAERQILGPYRLLIVLRFIFTGGFLYYRARSTPSTSAMWIWALALICEFWFYVMGIMDQLITWSPVVRQTYLDRFDERFQEGSEELPYVDVFITTADAEKEPPLITAQTILSVLAVDYPPERLAVYLSDDGAAKVSFEVLTEAAGFARLWIPFCKKYNTTQRNPETYFSMEVDYTKGQISPDFVKTRRAVKREYEEFKVRVNALVASNSTKGVGAILMTDGTPWLAQNRGNHDGIIQVVLHPESQTKDMDGGNMPGLVYMSRAKKPGYPHHMKGGAMNALLRASGLITNGTIILNLDCDHYVNNPAAVKEVLCFFMDPAKGKEVGYVQYPQRFDGIDKNDRYANKNTVFFDVSMKGFDGIQGPMYCGTGCAFRRLALYGFHFNKEAEEDKPHSRWAWWQRKKKRKGAAAVAPDPELDSETQPFIKGDQPMLNFGLCQGFVDSVYEGDRRDPESPKSMLRDVILAISADYEDETDWGDTIGWKYGSLTEDMLTGMMIHSRGWRSVYCNPRVAAVKGSAPLNMTDRLVQVMRWATGSLEVFCSGMNPLWYKLFRSRLRFRQRLAYINTVIYPFTSILLIIYCCLPPISMLTSWNYMIPPNGRGITFFGLMVATYLSTIVLQLQWSAVSLEAFWRNEQFWLISAISAHLFAVLQTFFSSALGMKLQFVVTAKLSGDDTDELHTFKYSNLLVTPTFVGVFNVVGLLATGVKYLLGLEAGMKISTLIGKTSISIWVILHLVPFWRGMLGRLDRLPTIVYVWALTLLIALGAVTWSSLTGQ